MIQPCNELFGQKIFVPGDISSAAYFIAAGLLVPHSEIVIKNVGINPTRAGILSVCEAMGADITYLSKTNDGGELLLISLSAQANFTAPSLRVPRFRHSLMKSR